MAEVEPRRAPRSPSLWDSLSLDPRPLNNPAAGCADRAGPLRQAVAESSLATIWPLPICLTGPDPPFIIKSIDFLVCQPAALRPRAGALRYPTTRDASLYILIALLVVILATFVLAYFAARTWHWAYVLVVVGLVLSSAGFFILSLETLRINSVLGKYYNETEKKLNDANAQLAALQKGTSDATVIGKLRGRELKAPDDATSIPSIGELDHEIRLEAQARGPVWRNVTKVGVDQQSLAARVTIEKPTPAGIVPNTVVYMFEEGEPALPDATRGAQYLGEFRVTEAAGQTATLSPAMEMNETQQKRLLNSRGPWVIYQIMPPDRYEVFAGLTEEQLKQKLPETSVQEYIHHGQVSVSDDDPLRKVDVDDEGKRLVPDADGKLPAAAKTIYTRRLRDYALEFRKLAEQRAAMLTDKAGLELDNQRLAEAQDSAERLTTARQTEIAKLKNDLGGIAKDRQAIDKLLTMVQQQVDKIRTLLDQTLRENSQLVRKLAAGQAAMTKSIDKATSAPDGATTPLALGRTE